MNQICVIGLGYIGLPTSIVAANSGLKVIGFDIDKQRVERINASDPIIEEPDLLEKLKKALLSNNFYATNQIVAADCFIIAVPTPFKENKKADLSYVWSAAESIATVLKKDDVVILESTVPVGATDQLAQKLQNITGLKAGIDFYVAHCPERVLPGKIFHELVFNSRTIGGINELSVDKAKVFYKRFVKASLYLTNATTAEMVKLVENSSRDVEIAFAHQVAAMAYKMGLNPFEVIELANKHPRVNILNPSCGVGGHCLAVDPWFLVQTFPEQTELLCVARNINDSKPLAVIKAVEHCVAEWKKDNEGICKVAVLGLAYKPDIDDLRESPALKIAQELHKNDKIEVLPCEPYISDDVFHQLFGKKGAQLQLATEQADIIVCLVKHAPFKKLNKSIIDKKQILDFCGLFYEPHVEQEGQERFFWPASTAAIRSIRDHV
jgi:UDP-N-acetyl-D-mannosaminuronic acid dehydrogenase